MPLTNVWPLVADCAATAVKIKGGQCGPREKFCTVQFLFESCEPCELEDGLTDVHIDYLLERFVPNAYNEWKRILTGAASTPNFFGGCKYFGFVFADERNQPTVFAEPITYGRTCFGSTSYTTPTGGKVMTTVTVYQWSLKLKAHMRHLLDPPARALPAVPSLVLCGSWMWPVGRKNTIGNKAVDSCVDLWDACKTIGLALLESVLRAPAGTLAFTRQVVFPRAGKQVEQDLDAHKILNNSTYAD